MQGLCRQGQHGDFPRSDRFNVGTPHRERAGIDFWCRSDHRTIITIVTNHMILEINSRLLAEFFSDCSLQQHGVSNEFRQSIHSGFKYTCRAFHAKNKFPWLDVAAMAEDAIVFVEHDDIDGKSHETRMQR